MFSGIIADIGTVIAVRPCGNGRVLEIRTSFEVAPPGAAGVGIADRNRVGAGDSIAVNGVCLTVDAVRPPGVFSVSCGAETLDCTNLGQLRPGGKVHLERALRLGDPVDGHLVLGHVDGVGRVREARRVRESLVLRIEAPGELGRYIAVKGSIAVDGVSLTVNEVAGSLFRVNIIPYTAEHTCLGALTPGDAVNIEVDMIARYLERLLGTDRARGGLSPERLQALGFGGSSRGDS